MPDDRSEDSAVREPELADGERKSTARHVSVVLPVRELDGRSPHAAVLRETVEGYLMCLDELAERQEILLVPYGGSGALKACEHVVEAHPGVRNSQPCGGWGSAVREGLRLSEGELLCYANYERTSPAVLAEMLGLALRNPTLVLRANRRTRDTVLQRIGSLLYNLECRALLGIAVWDVNGTPKVFPRRFGALLELKSEGDLLDAELAAVCDQRGYPVVEVPVQAELRSGLSSRPAFASALRMYLGVPILRRRLRDSAPI
jgi:hypothetical protein